jgi:hypothetical protein
MSVGFRGWLYRFVSVVAGITGIFVSLSLVELARLYRFSPLEPGAGIALGVSFLILMTAFVGQWSWKRYAVLCFVLAVVLVLPYLALRPEMIRDDVLAQLTNPPLSADLLIYRGLVLRDDPEREVKIQRMGFIYGYINTYGDPRNKPVPGAK